MCNRNSIRCAIIRYYARNRSKARGPRQPWKTGRAREEIDHGREGSWSQKRAEKRLRPPTLEAFQRNADSTHNIAVNLARAESLFLRETHFPAERVKSVGDPRGISRGKRKRETKLGNELTNVRHEVAHATPLFIGAAFSLSAPSRPLSHLPAGRTRSLHIFLFFLLLLFPPFRVIYSP